MTKLSLRTYFLLLVIASSGCNCLNFNPSCESRNLRINKTAPPDKAEVSSWQRYAIIVKDPQKDPLTLSAAVRFDDVGVWHPCIYGTETEQAIDGAGLAPDEFYFFCTVEPGMLSHGEHKATYSVDGSQNTRPVRKEVRFSIDAEPPSIMSLDVSAVSGGAKLNWSVARTSDFASVGFFVNGVHVVESRNRVGEVTLGPSIRESGSSVEFRAADEVGNVATQSIVLP